MFVDHCVVINNDVGIRFGDSYDWGCRGSMTVTNTILYNNTDNIRNHDIKTNGPVENAIGITYSMTNDSEYDGFMHCITGIPLFDENYYLTIDSPGIGVGINMSDMGKQKTFTSGPIVINEFLALNNSLYCDEFGEFDDWVELYNPGNLPYDVGGMYLTDDLSVPGKWQIPSTDPSITTIDPGAFLILWLDGNPEQGSLHLDLKLSGAGEQIGLFLPDRITPVDSLTFGTQTENVSFGRSSDGMESRSFFANPTPGLNNSYADIPHLQEYHITCNPDSFALIYERYNEDIFVPIVFSHGSRTWKDVKMRIRGETSRKYPKKSLRIVFDSQPYSNGRDVLIFNAEYYDKSYMRQYISSTLFRESDHPCFEAEYARLYLNGTFLGLYLKLENVDKDFLDARSLDSDGNLYKASIRGSCLSIFDDIEYHWDKKANVVSGHDELIQLIENLNYIPDLEYYEYAKETFDYKKMINIIALNMLIANGSTYYHNYYMYQDVNGSGKWTMFPWDLDKTLSSYSWDFSYQQSGWWGYRTPDNPFVERALICEPIFNDIRVRIDELRGSLFNIDYISPVVDSLKALLETSILMEESDNISDLSEWETAVENNLNFIEDRYNLLQTQFDNWPHSFLIERPKKDFTDEVTLSWHPSTDPNGDDIKYKLKYSPVFNFPDSVTTIYTDLANTTFTLPQLPEEGTYYWTVFADDGVYSVEGFDMVNTFTVHKVTMLPESITSDTVLDKDGSPYRANGNIDISANALLTVKQGVTIQMPSSGSIFVYGNLKIEGTENDPVILTSVSESERWGALCFESTKSSSTISHAVIENASVIPDSETYQAAVSGLNTNLTIKNVLFRNVLKAIYICQGSIILDNCIFSESNFGDQVYAENASARISKCLFYNFTGGSAITLKGVNSATISDCTIMYSDHNGINIGGNSSDIMIDKIRLYDCKDNGISIGHNSTVVINRSVISGSSVGTAVFNGSYAFIDHVTFFKNNTTLSCYSTSSENEGSNVEVVNTIFSQSQVENLSVDTISNASVSYCLYDTGILRGKNIITENPRFTDSSQRNFIVMSDSPCIDAGNPDSTYDPDGTITDIGALYSEYLNVVINEINYHSSPLHNTGDWLELYNPMSSAVDMSDWYFKDEDDNHTYFIPESTTLEPYSYLVLCGDNQKFIEYYPVITNIIGDINFGLSAEGEQVRLFNSKGEIIDSLTYSDNTPWPVEADGMGHTLSLINPDFDNSDGRNWKTSKGYGTPGLINDVYEPANNVNSFLAKPFIINQNFPNPFNSTTIIPITLLEDCRVKITIYSILGQKHEIVFNGHLNKGIHRIKFDGSRYSTGLYFYTIAAGKYVQALSMTLIK
ncbi:CotH kinase family protein [Candidatus Latescibacterota bacterium]